MYFGPSNKALGLGFGSGVASRLMYFGPSNKALGLGFGSGVASRLMYFAPSNRALGLGFGSGVASRLMYFAPSNRALGLGFVSATDTKKCQSNGKHPISEYVIPASATASGLAIGAAKTMLASARAATLVMNFMFDDGV